MPHEARLNEKMKFESSGLGRCHITMTFRTIATCDRAAFLRSSCRLKTSKDHFLHGKLDPLDSQIPNAGKRSDQLRQGGGLDGPASVCLRGPPHGVASQGDVHHQRVRVAAMHNLDMSMHKVYACLCHTWQLEFRSVMQCAVPNNYQHTVCNCTL